METKMSKLVWVALFCVGLFIGPSAPAQIIYGQPPEAQTGFVYTSWSLDSAGAKSDISQFWLPLSGFIPLKDNLELYAFVATASSDVQTTDFDNDVAGLGDFRLQISQSLADDRFLLNGGLTLPTGKKELSTTAEDNQQAVINALSDNFLEFPMRRYGEGLGFSLMAGVAEQWGEANVGAGVRYEFIGKYDPYVGVKDYDPGDAFSIYAGGDLQGDRSIWSANVIFTTYAKDKQNGLGTIKQGSQLDFRLSAMFGTSMRRLRTFAQYVYRTDNKIYAPADDASGDIVDYSLRLYGDEINLSAAYDLKFSSKWYISPLIGLRHIGTSDGPTIDSEEEFGSSNIFKIGSAFGKDLSEQFSAELGVAYFTGSTDGGDIDLSGLQLTGSLSATF